MEMGHDLSNVQVIISNDDESSKIICLFNDEGVVKHIGNMVMHVIGES